MQDRKMELLELWKVALSPEAANQLDLRQYVTNSMVPGPPIIVIMLRISRPKAAETEVQCSDSVSVYRHICP